jgi:hypothetical protein
MKLNSSFLKTLFTSDNETSLKQIFSRNPEYWRTAFPKRSSQEIRSLSVYRKNLESVEDYSGKQLHILLLKSEGKTKRNPNALPLEQFCGPLVVSLNLIESPYSLRSFKLADMQILENINRLHGNTRPLPMLIPKEVPKTPNKQPPVNENKSPPKKNSVQPLKKPLNDKTAINPLEQLYYEINNDAFFMYRFKTLHCPNIKHKHN